MGDVNVNFSTNKSKNEFKAVLWSYGLKQLVSTRKASDTKTLIDIMAYNNLPVTSVVDVTSSHMSDHDIVIVTHVSDSVVVRNFKKK